MNVDNISKERFLKAKKKVTKKYPGAKTIMDPNGQYYVATENGRDICNLQVSQAINGYNFEGDDEEHWMYLYKDGTFTLHSAVVQILYPTAYEKDATIMKEIFRVEREEDTN